uniref:Large ribosomal subunit protein uL6c n=1 Tax=Araucaria cunninghamii TaxID=56994 RepID=A0A0D6R450_ARACU
MASLTYTVPSSTCALKNTFLGENGLRAHYGRNGVSAKVSVVSSVKRNVIECKESRIGKVPIEVPSNVDLVLDGQFVRAKGPLGELSLVYPNEIKVESNPESGIVKISKAVETRRANQMHGLFRTLTNNIVVGVSKGFEKKLQLVGVGYRATVEGNDLVMNLGFSHPVRIAVPNGLKVKVEENTRISITGRDKSAIGDFAAKIRKWRPPEPYKGKGIRYADEKIKLKEGKAGKKK